MDFIKLLFSVSHGMNDLSDLRTLIFLILLQRSRHVVDCLQSPQDHCVQAVALVGQVVLKGLDDVAHVLIRGILGFGF